MKTILGSVGNLIRFGNWWHSKGPFLMAMAYWCLIKNQTQFMEAIIILPAILLWIFTSASTGHFINDWFDIKIDSMAGKKNFAGTLTPSKRIIVLFFLISALLLPPVFFYNGKTVLLFTLIQLLLFVLYSHPYFRWKEKLWLGVFADCLYAFVLPVIVVISYCRAEAVINSTSWILLCAWLVAAGLRNILLHQLADTNADEKANLKTVPITIGERQTYSGINFILVPIEMILLLSFLCMSISIPVSLVVFSTWIVIKIVLGLPDILSTSGWKTSNHPSFSLVNNFYEQVLPLLFFGLLIAANPTFVLLLIAHLLLFFVPTKELFKSIIAFCVYLHIAVSKN